MTRPAMITINIICLAVNITLLSACNKPSHKETNIKEHAAAEQANTDRLSGIYVIDDNSRPIIIKNQSTLEVSSKTIYGSHGVPFFVKHDKNIKKYICQIHGANLKLMENNDYNSKPIFGTFKDMGHEDIYLDIFGQVYKKLSKTDLSMRVDELEKKTGFVFSCDTALDKNTGLMWTRAPFGKSNWIDVNSGLLLLSYAEYSDWRLPTYDELKTMVDYANGNAKDYFNSIGFSFLDCDYWTSSISNNNNDYAISVDICSYDSHRDLNKKSMSSGAWLVRTTK